MGLKVQRANLKATRTRGYAPSRRRILLEDSIVYYADFLGVTGDLITTPNSSAVVMDGATSEIWIKIAFDDWTPAAATTYILAQFENSGQYAYDVRLLSTGKLQFTTSTNGTSATGNTQTTVATGITDGEAATIKITRTASTGKVNFYKSSDDGVNFDQIGIEQNSGTGVLTSSTDELAIGAYHGGTFPVTGKLYEVKIFDGIDGSVVAHFNATDNPTSAGTHVSSDTEETYTWTDINSVKE